MIKNLRAILFRVKAVLRRRGLSEPDCEDLSQEAWVRVAQTKGALELENAEGYMMRTALNLSIDVQRARAARGEQLAVDDAELLGTAPNPQDALEDKQRQERLTVCLARLLSEHELTAAIFRAHKHEGLSHRLIAARFGLSVSAVEKHIAKATLLISLWMEGW